MHEFSSATLRAHFAQAADFTGQSEWPLDVAQIPAAVLLPLVPRPHGMQVLLTRRTDHLNHHAGQISFPGGRWEAGDASLSVTALRETEEEVGIAPDAVELLGALPDFGTPSGFRISPVVGLLHPEAHLRLDPFEVAEAFEIPLSFLVEPANYQYHRIRWAGGERNVHAVPYAGRFIWGATAGILHMLAEFLSQRR